MENLKSGKGLIVPKPLTYTIVLSNFEINPDEKNDEAKKSK